MKRFRGAATADVAGQPAARVCVVVSHPIPYFVPFYRELVARGTDLHVLFLSSSGLDSYFDPGFGRELRWAGMSLAGFSHEIASDHQLGDDRHQVRKLTQVRKLVRATWQGLERNRPEVVVLHGYADPFAVAALAWCRVRGVPSLLLSDSELLARRRRAVAAGKRVLLPPLFANVSGFLTVGDHNESYLAHYGVPWSKMFRMPIPTDDHEIRQALLKRADHRVAVRSELGVPPDGLVALFAGKLVARKRPMDVAEALAGLARRPDVPQLTVLLAGDGELRGQLEGAAARLPGSLRVLGFVDPARLAVLYAAADFYLHPAERDAHPLVIKDAVLAGLPVVTSSRVGSVGPTDDVRPGRNGRIYPVGDVSALAAELAELCCDPARRAALASESERIAGEIGLDAAVSGFQRAVAAVAGQVNDRDQVLGRARSRPARSRRAKVAVARLLTGPVPSRAVELATRNRIRNNGLTFDVSDSLFTPRTKAALFWRLYESAEIRMVRRHLRGTTTVVELGSSLGITSAHLASVAAAGGRLVCVEANPRLADGLRARVAPFAAHLDLQVDNLAISAAPGEAALAVGANPLGSKLVGSAAGGRTVVVATATLRQVLAKHGVGEFDLVSDVEGAEASYLVGDPGVLRRCRRAVLELHDTEFDGHRYSASDLLAAAKAAGFRVVGQHGPVVTLERIQVQVPGVAFTGLSAS